MAKRKFGKDEILIAALAAGATVEVAAEKAGVSPRTVYRRLENDDFCDRLEEFLHDILRRASGSLIASISEPTRTILNLQKESFPPGIRLGAARINFDVAIRFKEITDINERLLRLEEHANINKVNTPPTDRN